MVSKNTKLSILGLGYVGLPLSVAFGKKYDVVGFDVDKERIFELSNGSDRTLEVTKEEIRSSTGLNFSSDEKSIKNSNVFIITVPTPVTDSKKPDLKPLRLASETVARCLKKNDLVIYESTVYPGATEEECIPILEKISGLKVNTDFGVGYSPERINPGDKTKKINQILKLTSGSNEKAAKQVDDLYRSVIDAGTYLVSSIKVAEAAKVIENTQRDVNIGLVNELAKLFFQLNIDTEEVLQAANTKWNFLNFKPGLVGGHCIGVDPHYLTYKAQEIGYYPEIILAGRRINDSMAGFVATNFIKKALNKGIELSGSKVLVMGISFKENCPDLRNTKVIDLIKDLREYGLLVDCYDPVVDPKQALQEYDLELKTELNSIKYDGIILAVAHDQFKKIDLQFLNRNSKTNRLVFDLKSILPSKISDFRL